MAEMSTTSPSAVGVMQTMWGESGPVSRKRSVGAADQHPTQPCQRGPSTPCCAPLEAGVVSASAATARAARAARVMRWVKAFIVSILECDDLVHVQCLKVTVYNLPYAI